MDTQLFYWINHLPHFKWLDAAVIVFAGLGVNEILIPMFLALFFGFLFKKHKVWQAALMLIIAFIFVNYMVDLVKPVFARPRPITRLQDVRILGKSAGGYSFPSLSAANVAVLFSYIYFVTRRKLALWAFIIFILGVCRVYQGIHYPTDVLGGWALGILAAYAAYLIYKFIHQRLALS